MSFRQSVLAVVMLAMGTGAHAQIVYVDDDAPSGGDGTAWATAYNDLQTAISATTSGEIWVASGFYTPGQPGDESSSFAMRSGVALYGGFAGTETSRTERDWLANETILSGDIGRDDVYGFNWNIHTGNSDHVLTATGVDSSGVLDGFTVIGGHSAHAGGAGLMIQGGDPVVRNCSFKWNMAGFAFGGAVLVVDGRALLEVCEFRNNWSHLYEGGGLSLHGASEVIVRDSVFATNTSTGSGREAAGGAISSYGDALTVERCTFTDNVARGFWPENDVGGYGGAIHCLFGQLTVVDSRFERNWSNAGGAIWTWTDTDIINCVFVENDAPVYQRSVTDWGGDGGAIGGASFSERTLRVINSTVYGNYAKKGGGINIGGSFVSIVTNTILWGNTDRAGTVGPSQIRGSGASYSCIQNMLEGEQGEDPPDPEDFPHCIDVDPLFAMSGSGDFHLTAGSPCIDAADNDGVPAWVTFDFDGHQRFVDDPDTVDTGNGVAPIVDMGAFEFQPAATTVLTDVAFRFGSHLSGSLADLVASDDAYLVGRSQVGFSVIEPIILELTIGATTETLSPTAVDVRMESRMNNPGGVGTVRFKNWATGQFEIVHTFATTQSDAVEIVEGISAVDRVRAPDRRLEMSIRFTVAATFSAFGFDAFFDQVRVDVE